MTSIDDPFAEKRLSAIRLLDSGRVREALASFIALAREGDIASQMNAGHCCELLAKSGIADRENYLASAEDWYRNAVDATDSVEGNLRLGYFLIFLSPRSDAKSEGVEHLQIASACGNANAMTWLGIAFQKGIGVDRDLERARKCFEDAAARGLVWPIVLLSKMEFKVGKYWRGIALRYRAAKMAWKIAGQDPRDERLWHPRRRSAATDSSGMNWGAPAIRLFVVFSGAILFLRYSGWIMNWWFAVTLAAATSVMFVLIDTGRSRNRRYDDVPW